MSHTGKLEKWIRNVTVPPILALVMLTILWIFRSNIYGGYTGFILSIVFLTILPVSAYPLQTVLPGWKNKGREGQRNLAMWTAVFGYILGIGYTLAFRGTQELLFIYLLYLFSGVLVFVFNKLFKIRASGHACGVVGPIIILVYVIGWLALVTLTVLIVVYWASLNIKRHTLSELVLGSFLPVAAFIFILLFIR